MIRDHKHHYSDIKIKAHLYGSNGVVYKLSRWKDDFKNASQRSGSQLTLGKESDNGDWLYKKMLGAANKAANAKTCLGTYCVNILRPAIHSGGNDGS